MPTDAATRSRAPTVDGCTVTTRARLRAAGWSSSAIDAQFAAGRWQRCGRAVVLHNAVLSAADRRAVALIHCGNHAVLAGLTAAELHGLAGWQRAVTHVLVPGGTHVRRPPGIPMRLHYAGTWPPGDHHPARRLQRIAPALALGAATMDDERFACGLLAAGVQQRLTTAAQLGGAVAAAPRMRHHRLLRLALGDIAQGAQAFSEIDFARLCRRNGLTEPVRQAVRREASGRRRYLDVEWTRSDGRRVVAEVDGALHLAARRWWSDQLRQNELVLSGDLVLRFPTVVFRCEPQTVVDQLRRALFD